MDAKKIKEQMKKLSIGQRELSKRSGISLPTVHNIVSGNNKNPRIAIVITLADTLGLTLDEITGHKGEIKLS